MVRFYAFGLAAIGLLLGNACTTASSSVRHDKHHSHRHSTACGHTTVNHDGHVDYLHEDQLHSQQEGNIESHSFAVNEENPDDCQGGLIDPADGSLGEELGHVHGENCGHAKIPHGDHVDYMVSQSGGYRLHHNHQGHQDDHGPIQWADSRW